MTKVDIAYEKGHISKLSADGHTGYGVSGEDVVCAALSSVIQTALLGLMQVAGVAVDIKRDDRRGYLAFELNGLDGKERADADIILNTMLLGVDDLYQGYSDFIELNITGK